LRTPVGDDDQLTGSEESRLEEAVALITQFTEIQKDTNQVHGEVECGYTIFDRGGSTFLQLDTYGLRGRKFQGK
jgi:hypothetical protein